VDQLENDLLEIQARSKSFRKTIFKAFHDRNAIFLLKKSPHEAGFFEKQNET